MNNSVGKEIPRIDAEEKVRGQAVFAADVHLPGELVARFLPSPHAHAEILSIDTAQAEALPGVFAVITAADIPQSPRYDTESRLHAFLARQYVVFQGQAVAAVAAIDLATAEAALDLIEVEYRPLPVIATLEDALSPGAALVAKGNSHAENGGETPSNVGAEVVYRQGNVEKAFEESDVVIENTYTVSVVHQAYIEPHAVTAHWDAANHVSVWECVQGAHLARDLIAHTLNIPHTQITINTTEIGGGFGGKIEGLFAPIAVLLAKKSHRPVKLVLTRTEEFLAGNPAPASQIRITTAATKDGKLTGLEAEILLDVGAFPTGWIMQAVIAGLGNTYKFPAWRLEAMEILTNKASVGSYRAPGATNASFAIESQMDEMAQALNLDPLTFRFNNLLQAGELLPDKELQVEIGSRQVLEALKDNGYWPPETIAYQDGDGWLHGYGLALAGWDGGKGPSSVMMTLEADGRFSVLLGTVDVTGSFTSLAQIAAEVLDVAAERIIVVKGSPGVAPFAPLSAGSQTIYATGAAVLEAALDLKRKLYERAAAKLETDVEQLAHSDDTIYVKDQPSSSVSYKRLFQLGTQWYATGSPLIGTGSAARRESAPGYAATAVHVAVEPETGLVKVLDLAMAQDVGKAINPHLVKGQMEGGAVQSIGFALWEEVLYTGQAIVRNPGLLDYRLPTAADVPDVQTLIVEAPGGNGPYGAKLVGEPPIITPLAAIANAVRNATGVRITALPLTPERIWQAMQEAVGQEQVSN